MRRRARALVVFGAGLAALTLAACGGSDFENEPRPAVPAEVSIRVGADSLVVSPREFGAGVANFTILNQGDVPTGVAIDGPTEARTSAELLPGTTSTLKLELKQGEYEAAALDSEAKPFRFAVGSERESANNDLLLP